MSREQWKDNVHFHCGSGKDEDDTNLDQWKELSHHTPLEGRTDDPEALELDRATSLFREGLALARKEDSSVMDLHKAATLVAAAFLLDKRAVKFVGILPPGQEEEAGLHLIDARLCDAMAHVDDLVRPNRTGPSAECVVCRIIWSSFLGHLPGGQTGITKCLQETEELIDVIAKNADEVEDPEHGPLHGTVRRDRLHYARSLLYMSLGNHGKAAKELTKILDLYPDHAPTRSARVSLWASNHMKDRSFLAQELHRILADSHPDATHLRTVYAWLALFALEDPTIGTLQQACEYRNRSKQADARYRELYEDKLDLSLLVKMDQSFTSLFLNATKTAERKFMDTLSPEVFAQDEELHNELKSTFQSRRHACLNCGRGETSDGRKLSKCGRCKQVSYCSSKCQLEDWKEHKASCRLASKKTSKSETSSKPAPETTDVAPEKQAS